ncbi:MAG TPA: glycosyltransferase family 4 protein [Bacteroidales bacterium]|nr:glycosyltransferase family 4 protein [Bacteroidales bacterium]
MMKILQVCGGPSWGGIEMQTVKLALVLQNAGHSTCVFCSADGEIFKNAVEKKLKTETGLFNPHTSWFHSLQCAKKIIRNFNPDIIHVQRSHDLSVLTAALRLMKCKTPLVFSRRMESRLKKKSPIHHYIYSRVNRVWCVSSFVRENFLATSPMKPEKVFVMNNGIDLRIFNPERFDKSDMRAAYSIPLDAIVIGMTGRISPMKGHTEFIRAAAMLLEKTERNLFFVMGGGASVGEDDYATEIFGLAKELLPKNKYAFIGQQPDLAGLLSTMDVYVFPSHRESFGNVLLEAMAMQLPIVAVNAGGVPDMITSGENALCVRPQHPEEIYSSVHKLLNNNHLSTQLAQEARKRALDFSSEKFLENLIKEYQEVIEEKY